MSKWKSVAWREQRMKQEKLRLKRNAEPKAGA